LDLDSLNWDPDQEPGFDDQKLQAVEKMACLKGFHSTGEAIRREHQALQHEISKFFSFFVGHSSFPGSGSESRFKKTI
jgi:hypothetical protein